MPHLSDLGADSLGVWTRAQALTMLSAGEVDALVRRRIWQVVWSGVYADGGFVLDAEQRAMAAVLAAGGADQPVAFGAPDPDTGRQRRRLRAVACGRSAARVWQLPLIDDDDPATGRREAVLDDVASWRHLAPQSCGERRLCTHEPTFGQGDLIRLPSGLWLTSPLRTMVDSARLLTHEALVCVVDDALHRSLVVPVQLEERSAARRGDEGAPAWRRAVRLADGRAEAPTETLARLLLLPVLPDLRPQVVLYDKAARLVARFDLGDEGVLLAVETDGRAGHAGEQMVAKDRRRDRHAAAYGWWTERATWYDLRRRQDDFRTRIVSKHAELARLRPPR
ncbi:MAG: hypothetical protein ACR2K2_09480 [Mycobacteriales bacterium]